MAVTGKTARISDALNYHLTLLVLSPVRRIAWRGLAFEPVKGEVYLEPSYLPNQSDYAAIGANAPRRHKGLYQITVVSPINAGEVTADEIADLVIEHFEAETITRNSQTVRIGSFDGSPGLPYRVSTFPSEGWNRTAVTVPWWTDTFI